MSQALIDGHVFCLYLGHVNAYLLDDGDVTLVDAGTRRSLDTLRAEVRAAGYTIGDIDRILVTHFDLDHVGGLADLATTAPVYAMQPDASFTDGSRKPSITSRKGVFQRLTGILFTPIDAVDPIEDGDAIGKFTAYHTPGHTPGHAVFVHEELPVAMLGDLVRATQGRLERPPWFLNYDTQRVAESIRDLAHRELSFDVAAIGHGKPLVDGGDESIQALARRLG